MAPPGCGLLHHQHIGMGFFSDMDPIVIVYVLVCVREREVMYLGPQQHPGSRGPCYDPPSHLGSFRR